MKRVVKISKLLVITAAVLLVVSFSFAISGAWYRAQRNGKAEMIFSEGIRFNFANVNNSADFYNGTLLYYVNGNTATTPVDFSNVQLAQNTSYKIAKPSITAASNSISFYARAKFEFKYYVSGENEITASELGLTESALKNEIFPTFVSFTANWVESSGYYYYCKDSSSSVTSSTVKTISAGNTINILQTDIIQTGYWVEMQGGPYGINKVVVSLKLDLIETARVSVWGL